jgi:hypothetical protein
VWEIITLFLKGHCLWLWWKIFVSQNNLILCRII